jgi:antagonist of KipI
MTLRVIHAGLHSLVIDGGRPGYRSLGLPGGGAADRFSLAIGNALVGNRPDAAALEVTLAGPTLQAACPLACVVFGAPFDLASNRQRLTIGTTFTLEAGEELVIAGTRKGARAYLCVRGGLQGPEVLGSHSMWDPVTPGQELACQPGRMGGRHVRGLWEWNREPYVLRTVSGPQADWFEESAFYDQAFQVTEASNRMGLRLAGPLPEFGAQELTSEPVAPGAVQVTPDRQCIVLGVDGQTIGGYPKVAHVIAADVDKLGQLRAGDSIRFQRVQLNEAERLYRQKQEEMRGWVVRLRAGFEPDEVEQASVVGYAAENTTGPGKRS